jgi:hypothetical protein
MNVEREHAGAAKHEHKDIDVLGVAMIAGFLLLIVGVTLLCVLGMLHVWARQPAARAAERPDSSDQRAEFPPPRLEFDATAEASKGRAAEEIRLNSYGWIDRKAGVAHIPVERAMQLLAARGLPEVGSGQTRLQLMQSRAAPEPTPNESKP